MPTLPIWIALSVLCVAVVVLFLRLRSLARRLTRFEMDWRVLEHALTQEENLRACAEDRIRSLADSLVALDARVTHLRSALIEPAESADRARRELTLRLSEPPRFDGG